LRDLSTQLRNEITLRIITKNNAILSVPPLCTDVVVSDYNQKLINVTDFEQTRRLSWDYFNIFSQLSFLTISTRLQTYYAYERTTNGTINLYRSDSDTGIRRLTYHADPSTGEPVANWGPVAIRNDYIVTDRGWYQTASQANGTDWTDVYYFSTGTLGLTRSNVFRDDSGSVFGVVTADFVLGELNLMMRSTKVSKSGRTYIVDKAGLLIASSAGSIDDGALQNRLAASNSSDPVIASVSRAIVKKYGSYSTVFTNGQTSLSTYSMRNNKKLFLQISEQNIDDSLNWIIVVIVPESDLMQRVKTTTSITMSITAVTIVLSCILALSVSILLSRVIAVPLERASKQMDRIALLDFDELSRASEISSLFEFRKIERALRHMKVGLSQYKRFVPMSFLKEMKCEKTTDVVLGHSEVLDVVLLRVEITNFSTCVLTKKTTLLFDSTNRFQSYISSIVRQNKGFLGQYNGASCIGVFQDVKQALNAAKMIQSRTDSEHMLSSKIKLSCSMCKGEVFAGMIGDEDFMTCCLLSDTMFVLDMMSSLAKKYQVSLLVTDQIEQSKSVRGVFNSRLIGIYTVKQRENQVIKLYDIRETSEEFLKRSNEVSDIMYSECGNIQHAAALLKQILFTSSDVLSSEQYRQCQKLLNINATVQEEMHVHEVLTEPRLKTSFQKYCVEAHAQENVDLWIHLNEMRGISDPVELKSAGQSIYDKFINLQSPHAANVGSDIAKAIQESLNNPNAEIDIALFISLQFEIQVLLETALKSFKQTKEFSETFYASNKAIRPAQQFLDLDSQSITKSRRPLL